MITARDVALGFKMPAEAPEQLVDQARLRQLLAELPKRSAVRNTVSKPSPTKRVNESRSRT
jgi:hypothetical protein